ncbi:MAG: Rab family GTPase [Candidatus Hodarchaeales archaeon]|jgi:small GTP-binding protein
MSAQIEDDVRKAKVLVVGEGAVGKTTLINRFCLGTFQSNYKATIGVDIFSKEVRIKEKDKDLRVKLQIWDIAGQAMFRQFRMKFFANAQGALLVFDVTVPSTLENLNKWVADMQESTKQTIPTIVLGNKTDLTELHSVSSEDVQKFLDQHNNVSYYFPTSALSGENVETAFSELVTLMI